jgi:hypothetical protein
MVLYFGFALRIVTKILFAASLQKDCSVKPAPIRQLAEWETPK